MMLLYAVTDRTWTGRENGYMTLYHQVEAALKGGATCIQLREKNLEIKEMENVKKETIEIRELCKQYKVPFIIDDDVDLAVTFDADGVHVGQEDMSVAETRDRLGKEKIIGVSVHNVEEALKAEAMGADYLGIGAAFATSTKENARVMTKKTMQEICKSVHIPVVAIGGINAQNISKLEGSGVDGIALVSAIFSASDMEGTCRLLKQKAIQTFYRKE